MQVGYALPDSLSTKPIVATSDGSANSYVDKASISMVLLWVLQVATSPKSCNPSMDCPSGECSVGKCSTEVTGCATKGFRAGLLEVRHGETLERGCCWGSFFLKRWCWRWESLCSHGMYCMIELYCQALCGMWRGLPNENGCPEYLESFYPSYISALVLL